jgi:hypothetical protein
MPHKTFSHFFHQLDHWLTLYAAALAGLLAILAAVLTVRATRRAAREQVDAAEQAAAEQVRPLNKRRQGKWQRLRHRHNPLWMNHDARGYLNGVV